MCPLALVDMLVSRPSFPLLDKLNLVSLGSGLVDFTGLQYLRRLPKISAVVSSRIT